MLVETFGLDIKHRSHAMDTIEAFLVHLLMGLTFEFGDDLYCWGQVGFGTPDFAVCQRDMVAWTNGLASAAPYAAFVGTLIGYAITPLSAVLAAFTDKPKNPGQAFGRAFGLELVEGALSVIGQVITDADWDTALWSLALSAVIAPIRGFAAFFTALGPFGRFLIVLATLSGLAVVLDRIGVLQI